MDDTAPIVFKGTGYWNPRVRPPPSRLFNGITATMNLAQMWPDRAPDPLDVIPEHYDAGDCSEGC